MHLTNSFSQRRRTKPRDLHIRKVSFSGSSLSSGCSFSSTSSTSTILQPTPRQPPPQLGFDPLSLHPTFQAPPPPRRLSERPFILSDKPAPWQDRWYGQSSFFDDSEDEVADDASDFGDVRELGEAQSFPLEMPPHATPVDCPSADDDVSPSSNDYFFLQLHKRPQLCSRWSESTIQTLEELTPVTSASHDGYDDEEDDGYTSQYEDLEEDVPCAIADIEEEVSVAHPQECPAVPNFSYKRDTVLPKRPEYRTIHGVEDFIKRGGWKRRGIVFSNEGDGFNASRQRQTR